MWILGPQLVVLFGSIKCGLADVIQGPGFEVSAQARPSVSLSLCLLLVDQAIKVSAIHSLPLSVSCHDDSKQVHGSFCELSWS